MIQVKKKNNVSLSLNETYHFTFWNLEVLEPTKQSKRNVRTFLNKKKNIKVSYSMKLTRLLQISTRNLMNGKSNEEEGAREREGGISIIEPLGPKKKKI
jgi:hypothetical protein